MHPELAFVAAWFLFGMTRIVFTSKMAQHRIDHPTPTWAFDLAATAARKNAANYDARGRRLLPWFRAVNRAYWTIALGGLSWIVLHALTGA